MSRSSVAVEDAQKDANKLGLPPKKREPRRVTASQYQSAPFEVSAAPAGGHPPPLKQVLDT